MSGAFGEDGTSKRLDYPRVTLTFSTSSFLK